MRVKQTPHKSGRAPISTKSRKHSSKTKGSLKPAKTATKASAAPVAALFGAARRKSKSGVRQVAEIKGQQGPASVKFATRTKHFKEMMRELVRSTETWQEAPIMVNGKTVYKYHGEGLGRPDVKWRKEAVDALRTGVEGMMTDWFALANDMACVNGKTIQPEHAEMAYKMMRPGYVSGRGKGASLESVILGSGFDSRMGLQERIVEQLEKTPADVVAWVWWKMTAKSKTSERSPPKRPTAEQKAKMIKKISKISSARPVEVAVKDTLGTDPRWYRAEEVKKGPKRGSVEYVLKQKTKETKSGKKVKVDLDPPPQLTDPGREDLVEGVSDLIVRLRAACAVREQPRLFTEAKILQALEWHSVDSKATRKKRTREGMEENLVEYQKRAAKRKEVKQQRAAVATVGDSGAEQGTKDGAEAKAGTEAKVDHEAKGKASQESEASGSDSDSENEDK